jgi:drug/metabolite transporter (DMT)-like permease
MYSFKLCIIILLYFISGISIVFYNKWLLSPLHYGFTYPITLIFIHMLLNFIFSSFLVLYCCNNSLSILSSPYHYKSLHVKQFLLLFVPVGILFGLDIVSTNISFRYVSISLTEVIKSAIPALLLLFGMFRKTQQFSLISIAIIIILCSGIALTSAGDLLFNWKGFFAAIIAVIAGTSKLILMEMLLGTYKNHPTQSIQMHTTNKLSNNDEIELVESRPVQSFVTPSIISNNNNDVNLHPVDRLNPLLSLFYFSPIAAVFLFIAFIFVEYSDLVNSSYMNSSNIYTTLALLFSGVILSFSLNLSELELIQHTSALTLCVLGVIKFLLVLALNALIFDSQLTLMNKIGCSLAVLGITLYNVTKYKQLQGQSNSNLIYNNSTSSSNHNDNNKINKSENEVVVHSSDNNSNVNNSTSNSNKNLPVNTRNRTIVINNKHTDNNSNNTYSRISTESDWIDEIQLKSESDENELQIIGTDETKLKLIN